MTASARAFTVAGTGAVVASVLGILVPDIAHTGARLVASIWAVGGVVATVIGVAGGMSMLGDEGCYGCKRRDGEIAGLQRENAKLADAVTSPLLAPRTPGGRP